MSDVYRVGVVLALSTHGLPLLGTLVSGLNRVGHAAQIANRHMGALRAAAIGAMGVAAGVGTLRAMVGMVRAGAELNTEYSRTLMLGGQIAENAARMRDDAVAWSQQIQTWNPAQLLALDRELATQVGVGEARELVPMLARLGSNISFATGGRDGGEHSVIEAYRTVEAVGGGFSQGPDGQRHFDPARFERFMNSLQGSVIASGGMVSIHDMMQASRQGGPSLRGMSPEVLFPYLAEAGIQMGASRAGTANMSWAQQFAGGIMTRRSAEALQHAHLLNAGEWHARRGGQIVVADEARRRLAEALRDPPAWVRDVLMPHMQGQDNASVMAAMMSLFGRQTTMRLIADLEQNNPQFFRMRENAANVPGVNQNFDMLNRTSVVQNINGLTEAWRGLEQVLSDAMTGPAIGVLHTLTDEIHRITQWAAVNPDTVEQIGVAVGVVAGSLALMGAGTVAAAALSMLAGPAGLIALAGGLGALAYAYRDDLPGLLNRVGDALGSFGDMLAVGVGRVMAAAPRWGAAISAAAGRAWDRLVAVAPSWFAALSRVMDRGWSRIVEMAPSWFSALDSAFAAGWRRVFGAVLPQSLDELGAQLRAGLTRILTGLHQAGDDWQAGLDGANGQSRDIVGRALRTLWDELARQLEASVMVDVNAAKRVFGALSDAIAAGLTSAAGRVAECVGRISRAVLDWVMGLSPLAGQVATAVGRISRAVLDWVAEIPGIAGQVLAALGRITAAILEWVAGLPGKLGAAALGAAGIKPTEPGQENHPNGLPTPGPAFGPQRQGDPSQAPGHLGKQSWLPPPKDTHLTSITNVTLDGRQIAANVETRLVRSGSGPSGGTTGFDSRTIYSGGMAVA